MSTKELTEDQKDEGVRDYWSMAVEAALYANLYFQDDLSQTAWDEKDVITGAGRLVAVDRKSTRLNSSNRCISYAVFCLQKKI